MSRSLRFQLRWARPQRRFRDQLLPQWLKCGVLRRKRVDGIGGLGFCILGLSCFGFGAFGIGRFDLGVLGILFKAY